jgi:hypothetical protein
MELQSQHQRSGFSKTSVERSRGERKDLDVLQAQTADIYSNVRLQARSARGIRICESDCGA